MHKLTLIRFHPGLAFLRWIVRKRPQLLQGNEIRLGFGVAFGLTPEGVAALKSEVKQR